MVGVIYALSAERWVSGWNQFPAKEPYLYTGTEGSNPSLSAIFLSARSSAG